MKTWRGMEVRATGFAVEKDGDYPQIIMSLDADGGAFSASLSPADARALAMMLEEAATKADGVAA